MTKSYTKDGRVIVYGAERLRTEGPYDNSPTYEERTKSSLMDGIGYVTELLNSQERVGSIHVRPTNTMFKQIYKQPKTDKKSKYNRILNEAVKSSAPQFYVEQIFRANTTNDLNHDRYQFKLDPNFMSCNSVYKTLALRGIYMTPKRYSVKYGVEFKIQPPKAPPEEVRMERLPVFKYEEITTTNYRKKPRVKAVDVKITDENGKIYTVHYIQDYKYTGESYQESTPEYLSIQYDTQPMKESRSNVITNYDIDNKRTVDFEFHPQGLVTITTRTEQNITDKVEIRLDRQWNDNGGTTSTKTRTTHIADINIIIPFTFTILPENSIEVFSYEIVKQVNDYLRAQDDENISACRMSFDYDSSYQVLIFTFESTTPGAFVMGRFVPIDDKHESDATTFYKILNQKEWKKDPTFDIDAIFEHVWNRDHFYVHASYMNLIQYNQLGRTDEQYQKPTKLTKYTSNIPDIEFWTSLDGVTPFEFIDQDFEVVVCLAATLNNAEITF